MWQSPGCAKNGKVNPVWQYFTNTRPGSNPSPLPTRAVRLANGNTLISDQFNDQVIEVDASKPSLPATA